MSKFLDRFLTMIPNKQAEQIQRVLLKLHQSGKLSTLAEYNRKLKELSNILTTTDPQPITKLIKALVGREIDSRSWNAMTESIRYDLETAFVEMKNIIDTLELHKNLFLIDVSTGFLKALNELEAKIDSYEYAGKSDDYCQYVQYNTFNQTDIMALSSTTEAGKLLYVDPRTNRLLVDPSSTSLRVRDDYGNLLPNDFSMMLDYGGECLIMPILSREEIIPSSIRIVPNFESNSSTVDSQIGNTAGALDAEGGISNVIDGTDHTYWYYPVLTEEKLTTGAKLDLEVTVANDAIKKVNAIEIQPACKYPMILESLLIETNDNRVYTLVNMDAEVLDRDKKFYLNELSTSKIKLRLLQKTCQEAVYKYSSNRKLWELSGITGELNQKSINSDKTQDTLGFLLDEEIQDPKMKEVLGLGDEDTVEDIKAYQYTFGLDNIRCFEEEYTDIGIFVSEPLTVNKPAEISLNASYSIPEISTYKDNQFAYTGSINNTNPTTGKKCVKLLNGNVLLTGGESADYKTFFRCEIYNVEEGTWADAMPLVAHRYSHTITLLQNGNVLVTGGKYRYNNGETTVYQSSCEVFNHITGKWALVSSMTTPRSNHTATLLEDGRVLVAGGLTTSGVATNSCEIYDPNLDTWVTTTSLNTARYDHKDILFTAGLNSNKVLIVSGKTSSVTCTNTCELYDSKAKTWSYTGSLVTGRTDFICEKLENGLVFVATGFDLSNPLSSVEVYGRENSSTWTTFASILTARYGATGTLITTGEHAGEILICGGYNSTTSTYLDTNEFYNPYYASGITYGSSTLSNATLNLARAYHTAILLDDTYTNSDSTVLLITGINNTRTQTCELCNKILDSHTVEFYLAREDYDINDAMIASETIPVLPKNSSLDIEHELLLPTLNAKDVWDVTGSELITNSCRYGITRFPPRLDDLTTYPITVYKDFQALTLGTDYYIYVDLDTDSFFGGISSSVDTWAEITSTISGKTNQDTTNIPIIILNIDDTATYTVSYTVKNHTGFATYTTSNLKNLTKFVSMKDDCTIQYAPAWKDVIDWSNIYLIAIFRSVLGSSSYTPKFLDYRIQVNGYDPEKFMKEV